MSAVHVWCAVYSAVLYGGAGASGGQRWIVELLVGFFTFYISDEPDSTRI